MDYTPLDQAANAALDALYHDLDADIARARPICELSGRCCRFVAYDHTLFLSEIEASRLINDAPPPVRPLDDGETCPWQDERGRCTARDARPLGCRIYYCDPSYRDEGPRLSEIHITRLKRLSEDAGRDWQYAPLHTHLRAAREAGRIDFPRPRQAPSGTDQDAPNP